MLGFSFGDPLAENLFISLAFTNLKLKTEQKNRNKVERPKKMHASVTKESLSIACKNNRSRFTEKLEMPIPTIKATISSGIGPATA